MCVGVGVSTYGGVVLSLMGLVNTATTHGSSQHLHATREAVASKHDTAHVRNIVVNQVISDDGNDSETFVRRISETQAAAVKQLMRATDALPSPPTITQVSYLDTEPRGVFGLKALAFELMKEHFKEPAQIV